MASLTFHQIAVAPVIGGLKNAHAFITKGFQHAKTQDIDPREFLTARLHPDMQDFTYQIYRFTDSAKYIPNRVNSAVEGISLPDEEKSFPELLQRIETTIKYLEGVQASSFEGQEGSEVVMKFGPAQVNFTALQYVTQFAHPNFW